MDLYIPNNKALFESLYVHKDKIDKEVNMELDWMRLDDRNASKIVHRIYGLDFDKQDNYPSLMKEIIKTVTQMRDVFKKYL